jgi:hypothetical protein
VFEDNRQQNTMKNKALTLTVLSALLLPLLGCEKEEKKAPPPASVGPFQVNGDTGQATGEAFGIRFDVAGATGVDTKFDLSGNPGHSSKAEITLAEDLKIQLEPLEEGNPVAFHLNGKKIGDLERGSNVEIDKDRSVTINGKKQEQ